MLAQFGFPDVNHRYPGAVATVNGVEPKKGTLGMLDLWLSESPYLAGDEASIADLLAYSVVVDL
jgi:glutathione S-transferase